jgi:26S proteasome subunit RPN7
MSADRGKMGNEDLGSHYYRIGDLANAVKAYSRMRDYCTTSAPRPPFESSRSP